ncbi:unnamed protein product [Cuscuta europaea]|uniref:Uncharacterized protein n=1 Tax=Cuscuta europaea TaxID=41803 RepID=A0A9P1DYH4_CUSEU|nr:unnamed protein product [Cuscuta europaea]
MHPHQEYTTSTVYLFLSYSNNVRHDEGYSLHAIDICVSDEQGLVVESPRLLVRLPLQNRPGMVCAKLGSKFYFLGGEKRDVLVGDNRPSDVFVYDPTNTSMNAKDSAYRVVGGVSMNYGKADPTTFEVNGKLYVLGCRYTKNVDEHSLFEEYDPVKNGWTNLEVTPARGDEIYDCLSSFVVSPCRVLISAAFGFVWSQWVILIFNPQTYEWTNTINTDTKFDPCFFVEDSFYGREGIYGLFKLGPFTFSEDYQLFHVRKASSIDWGDTSPISWPFFCFPPPLICHLYDRCFCVIIESDVLLVNGAPPHPNPRCLEIIIYKELQGDQTCFKLQFLHHSFIQMDTAFNCISILESCHVVSSGGKNKRILVGDKNVESNLEYENKVDDKKIGTNLC